MKQLAPVILMVIILVSQTSYAYKHKDNIDSQSVSAHSVLPPGAKLVAGKYAKNEFFILAAPERAHAEVVSHTNQSAGAEAAIAPLKIAERIKKRVAELQKEHKVLQHTSVKLKAEQKVKAHKKKLHAKVTKKAKQHRIAEKRVRAKRVDA